MSHKEKDHGKNNFDKNRDVDVQNDRRIDQLIDLVDKHTRTERHLEQHSDIASPSAVEHAEQIQNEREEEIENLKDIIAHGKNVHVDEVANLKRNIEYTDNYLENNKDHIDKKTLEKTIEKQENREQHIHNMFK